MSDREEFEKWFEGSRYVMAKVSTREAMFDAWQAALAQQAGSGEAVAYKVRDELFTHRSEAVEASVYHGNHKDVEPLYTHPRASMPNLSTIAQKKLDQMGATVHGVLVKNGAGAWVAVSDAGRVMWLDGFEGQAARQAPASGEVEPVAYLVECDGLRWAHAEHKDAEVQAMRLGADVTELFAHPPAKVPEGIEAATRYIEKKASDAVILRKQAEAVEAFALHISCMAGDDSDDWWSVSKNPLEQIEDAKEYAKYLHQQADESEKAGG